MTIKAANNKQPGVRTFYLGSESRPGMTYTVQFVRKPGNVRAYCTCPDFTFRRVTKAAHSPRRSCKHIKELRQRIAEAGGVSRLAVQIADVRRLVGSGEAVDEHCDCSDCASVAGELREAQ